MTATRLTRRAALALGLAGITTQKPFISAGKAMADSLPDTVVYVSNAGNPGIGFFSMNRDSGDLTPVADVQIPGTDKPSPTSMPMAVSPNRRFLYAGLRSQPYTVASFTIDPTTGVLTHLGDAPLADSMAYIVTDRSGRFLLSASYPGSKLAINPIDQQGRVQGQTTQIIPTKPKAHCILVDPTNKYCYATSLGGDIVMEWKFDSSAGRLSPNSPDSIAVAAGNGPRHLRFHPSRPFLYLITETTARIAVFAIDPETGTLREIEIVDTLPADFHEQPAAADLHITPDGRFIYGSERKSSTLAGFKIDAATGKLSPIGRWPTEKTPRGFNIDPRGRFLLSVGLDSNAMTVHRIDPQSGALSVAHQYPMGKMPNWVEIVDLK
ncbi:MAG TPA: lactonase family protein [Stellaceae bacterium]|nr:lactonase family protein [Stellaceae bacterium]